MRAWWLMAVAAATLSAQPKKEEPVGLMLAPGGAKLLRSGTETPLAARAGDILFAGDGLRSEAGAPSFLYCPSKSQQTLAPSSEAIFDAKQLKIKTGKIADQKTIPACFLPQVARVTNSSQQHYGVSMTRDVSAALEAKATPPVQWPPALKTEIAPLDQALAADPKDQPSMVARAALFEKYDLKVNAVEEYRKIAGIWADAVWVKGKIFELNDAIGIEASAKSAQPAAGGGQIFALLIGISKYQRLPQDLWLQFANADAAVFEKHVKSPRGGGLPPENVVTLTDDKATTAALRNAFQTFLKGRAGKNDTVLVLIAGHGTVESPGSKGAYILTYDSDPQDLGGTALPMAEVQTLINEELSKVGRVAVFVDVCRAGTIGTIRSTTVNSVVEKLGEAEGQILGLMASRPRELSREGPEFGGGHGAFSYYLLKGLEGAADKNNDGIVDVNETINYVTTEVAKATDDKQHPRDFGTMDNAVALADKRKPGIDLARADFPVVFDLRGEPAYLAAAQAGPGTLGSDTLAAIARYTEALDKKRILPDSPDSAFSALQTLQGKLPPQQFRIQENRLRIALEDQAQQVILKYLTGDQVPQTRSDFESGGRYYSAAQRLTPESLFLDGRSAFMRGRSLLFDKKYSEAAGLLEYAARIDPKGAHAYNALGIAYLEQANFSQAIPAFRDAIRYAPHWAYPLHNLALSLTESGDYNGAIKAYRQAMRIAPTYSYLPYNLGLVYQRLGKRKDAEASYHRAIELAPNAGEPLNALGSLKASTGKPKDAEQLYKQALEKNPKLLEARHNLAVLLVSRKDRQPEALALWRENLSQDADYLPSRLSLAAALPEPKEAIAEYEAILKIRPEYVAARLALAGLLEKTGDRDRAAAELRAAAKAEPGSSSIWERLGDLEKARNNAAEAKAAYEQAVEHAPDSAARKRIRKKL